MSSFFLLFVWNITRDWMVLPESISMNALRLAGSVDKWCRSPTIIKRRRCHWLGCSWVICHAVQRKHQLHHLHYYAFAAQLLCCAAKKRKSPFSSCREIGDCQQSLPRNFSLRTDGHLIFRCHNNMYTTCTQIPDPKSCSITFQRIAPDLLWHLC